MTIFGARHSERPTYLSPMRVLKYIAVMVAVAALANLLPRPREYRDDWRLGWPFVSVDALPWPMVVRMAGPVSYKIQLQVMQDVWNSPTRVAGPQFAPFMFDRRWRWCRLPNGHVILLQPANVAANSTISAPLAIGGYFLVRRLFVGFARRRRRRQQLCLSCGYCLQGNVTGICPECGTENHAVSAQSPESENPGLSR